MNDPAQEPKEGLLELEKLFAAAAKNGASDLHLKVGSPPMFRIRGKIVRAKTSPLSARHIEKLVYSLISNKAKQDLDGRGAADIAHSIPGVGRFRVNVFQQRGSISMAVRRVETNVPTLKQLHLPEELRKLANMERGLVISAGATGSGKSTTLASLIQIINETRAVHIITIEDPIEYLYSDKKAFVNQREIGIDVPDFNEGLRFAVRQDPDVILIGEMRDEETIETALNAAETGHLVFGTIHASSAPQSIGRILDFFPPNRHHQIRQMLYYNLRAVAVQMLIKGAQPEFPQVPALELMLVNPIIRKFIQASEDSKMADVIRNSSEEGMQDFNQSLVHLVNSGLVTQQAALVASPNPEQLEMNLKGIVLGSDRGMIVGN